jgi:hypothetical protein
LLFPPFLFLIRDPPAPHLNGPVLQLTTNCDVFVRDFASLALEKSPDVTPVARRMTGLCKKRYNIIVGSATYRGERP